MKMEVASWHLGMVRLPHFGHPLGSVAPKYGYTNICRKPQHARIQPRIQPSQNQHQQYLHLSTVKMAPPRRPAAPPKRTFSTGVTKRGPGTKGRSAGKASPAQSSTRSPSRGKTKSKLGGRRRVSKKADEPVDEEIPSTTTDEAIDEPEDASVDESPEDSAVPAPPTKPVKGKKGKKFLDQASQPYPHQLSLV